MAHRGRDFYDQGEVFRTYEARRARRGAPNDTLEGPAFEALVGDVRGRDILDLGCGDARWGANALDDGAASYFGVDASRRMLEAARRRLDGRGTLVEAALEEWAPPADAFDLAVSRLALHYVDDVGAVLRSARASLREGGRLVFSVEHPVITSCDRARSGEQVRADWIVDDYFREGPRETPWMGARVVKVHRSLESWLRIVRESGFQLEDLREGRPSPERFEEAGELARRSRIPLFLVIAAGGSPR